MVDADFAEGNRRWVRVECTALSVCSVYFVVQKFHAEESGVSYLPGIPTPGPFSGSLSWSHLLLNFQHQNLYYCYRLLSLPGSDAMGISWL